MSSSTSSPQTFGIVSEVWKHFTRDGPGSVRCNRCPKSFRRDAKSPTSNLWNHLAHHHENVYTATDYNRARVASGKLNRMQRTSAYKAQSASGTPTASQAVDDKGGMTAAASSLNEEGDAMNASEPLPTLPQSPLEMMLRAQPQMPQPVYAPVAMAIQLPVPAPQVSNNDLVDASCRAMMMRLRQLHEKDPRMFLHAQNAIANVLFKYEMEAVE